MAIQYTALKNINLHLQNSTMDLLAVVGNMVSKIVNKWREAGSLPIGVCMITVTHWVHRHLKKLTAHIALCVALYFSPVRLTFCSGWQHYLMLSARTAGWVNEQPISRCLWLCNSKCTSKFYSFYNTGPSGVRAREQESENDNFH